MTTKAETLDRIKHMTSLGYSSLEYQGWRKKWKGLKASAKKYDRGFKLSFQDYITLAHKAGLASYSQIGTGVDDYCMGRIGDKGGYEIGNCRFITGKQNNLEKVSNGGTKKAAEAKTGSKRLTIPADGRFTLVTPDGKVIREYDVKALLSGLSIV